MNQMIIDMFRQIGIATVGRFVDGIWYIDTTRKYIHYDELQPFTKLNNFKGIGISKDHTVTFQFIN